MAQLSSQFPAFVNVRVGRRVSPRGKRGRNTAARVTFIPRHEEERTMGNPRNYRNHPSTNLTERRWEERGGGEKGRRVLGGKFARWNYEAGNYAYHVIKGFRRGVSFEQGEGASWISSALHSP